MNAPSYSVENSARFEWSSVSGNLNPERVGHLAKHLRGKEILDAGCGGGAFVEYLWTQGFVTTGVDNFPDFLAIARARPGAEGIYIQGDVTALPFPDQSFDCTFCYDVLEHVDDQRALSELVRVTRDRIILAVPATDPNAIGGGLTFRHYQDLTHLRTYTTESLAELFRSQGLHRFRIFPELPVDFRSVAIEQLHDVVSRSSIKTLARRLYHALLRRLLTRAAYRVIDSGLAAVIELAPEGDGTSTDGLPRQP